MRLSLMRRSKLLAIVISVVCSAGFANLRLFAQATGWMDPAWPYRAQVTVSNPTGQQLSQFQVNVQLAPSFDFGKASPGGADLRVTSSDGQTQIPFWIEQWDSANEVASLWIKMPTIAASGGTAYLYYGNSRAVSASSGNSTFDFFDDFESGPPGPASYFQLGTPSTVLVMDQNWEATAPHSLSVVAHSGLGYQYWGYYGQQDTCGGVGLALSNDLNSWTKYTSNPLFLNGRWPSVVVSNGVFYMLYTKDYCQTSHIRLATSNDGLKWTDVKDIVPAQAGLRNQNPNLFYNPNDQLFYIYYYHGNDTNSFSIHVRSASSPSGLDVATDSVVLQSTQTLAAPNMLYYAGTYYLSTETKDSSGNWMTLVYGSSQPRTGFTLLPGNPVLSNGNACMFQHIFNGTLHNYNCNLAGYTWTVQHRSAPLTSIGSQPTLDPTKWTIPSSGAWSVVTATQQDGSTGHVAQGVPLSRDTLRSIFSGTDYVLDTYGEQIAGNLWGLGARVQDNNNLYSVNLYDNLNGSNNLYLYKWKNGNASTLASASVGTISPNVWHKLTVKAHGGVIEAWLDGNLRTSVSDGSYAKGLVALYGEAGTVAQFNNVIVRKYASTEPSTTVGPESTGISLLVSPQSVVGGANAQGTVNIVPAAPAGGATVSLSATGTAVTVPPSVSIPAGATQATFPISTSAVTSSANATITATYNGGSTSAQLLVDPYLGKVSISPSTVVGGSSATGTVVLNAVAPSGGLTVSLSSNIGIVSVPAAISIASGASQATFPVSTQITAATVQATVTATLQGATQTATITVAAAVSSLTVSPSSIVGGDSAQGTVVLGTPAPAGGATVVLSSTGPVSVPASVTVPQANTSAMFTVNTSGVSNTVSATITASYAGGSASTTASITPAVVSLTLNPSSVTPGGSSQATVTLAKAAPSGGAAVTLSTNNAGTSVPATVTVPMGSTSAVFTVNVQTSAAGSATISASYNGSVQTASLNIQALGGAWLSGWLYRSAVTLINPGGSLLTSFQVNVKLNSSFDFTKVANGGADLRFANSDGSTQLPFWIESWNPAAQTASLWVNVPSIPSNGTTIFMYYGNSAATIVSSGPATFDFFDDFSSGSVSNTLWSASGGTWTATSATKPDGSTGFVGQGVTTARQVLVSNYRGTDYVASAYGRQTAGRVWALGVRATGLANLYSLNLYDDLSPANNLYAYSWVNNTSGAATATLGAAAVGPLNLNQWYQLSAKVHGTTIEVFKDGTSVLTINNSSLAGGGVALYGESGTTAQWTNVLVRKYAASEPVASVGAFSSQFQLSISPSSVIGGSSSQGTITLGQPAPAGGVPVALSSSNALVTVPAQVTVASGTTQATFVISTNTVPTTTPVSITATTSTATQSAIITVVAALSGVSVNPATIVGGDSAQGTVALAAPAPSGGAVVSLSSNSSATVVPASLNIPQGLSSGTFPVATAGVNVTTGAAITATYAGSTAAAAVSVIPALVATALSPASVSAGGSTQGTVTLAEAAPAGGAVVTLSSDNVGVVVPTTITVAQGATTGTFTASIQATASGSANISATYNGSTQSAVLTIQQFPALVCFSQQEVAGGTAAPATCSLSAPVSTGHGLLVLVTFPVSETLSSGALTDSSGNTYSLVANQAGPFASNDIIMYYARTSAQLPNAGLLTLVPPAVWGAWNIYAYDLGPLANNTPDVGVATTLAYGGTPSAPWQIGPTASTTGIDTCVLAIAGTRAVSTPPLSSFAVDNGFHLLNVVNFHSTNSGNYPGTNLVTAWSNAQANIRVSVDFSQSSGPDNGEGILYCFR